MKCAEAKDIGIFYAIVSCCKQEHSKKAYLAYAKIYLTLYQSACLVMTKEISNPKITECNMALAMEAIW